MRIEYGCRPVVTVGVRCVRCVRLSDGVRTVAEIWGVAPATLMRNTVMFNVTVPLTGWKLEVTAGRGVKFQAAGRKKEVLPSAPWPGLL